MLCNMLCNMHTLHSNIVTSVSVSSLNNDRTVMSSTYAWRPLACLPFLKTFAFINVDWQAQRWLASALYHNAMAHIVADVNEFCLTDRHYHFADKIVRCCQGFWHFLSLDGAETAAATLCCTHRCPTVSTSSLCQSWTTLKNNFLSGKPVRSRSKWRQGVPNC